MAKPNKPNVSFPANFAVNGEKADFTTEKIENGFSSLTPDVLAGDNLNKFISDVYQSLTYTNSGVSDLYQSAVTYDSAETYNQNSIIFNTDSDGKTKLYLSKLNNNKGKSLDNKTYWEEISLGGNSRNIGELVYSSLPLTDAGLHLLDGSLIQGDGIYSSFVNHIASLYGNGTNVPSYFTTELDWQNTNTQYGSCGKFVYDSEANTLRLPNITDIIEGTTNISLLGNIIEAGLPALSLSSTGGHTHTGSTNSTGAHSHTLTARRFGGNSYTQDSLSNPGWGFDSGNIQSEVSKTSSSNGNHTHTFTTASGGAHTHTITGTGVGNSSTIQPQTVKMLVYIVVATSVKEEYEVDVDNITTDLNGKADRDLSNLTETGNKHFVNKTQITNCILEAPNGVCTMSSKNITIKSGLKVLIPNGRNADGTLKNIEYTQIEDVILTSQLSFAENFTLYYVIRDTGNYFTAYIYKSDYVVQKYVNLPSGDSNVHLWAYVEDDNQYYYNSNNSGWIAVNAVRLGKFATDSSGNVISYTIDKPLNLLKLNDRELITSWAFPSNKFLSLSLGDNGTAYTAPADGWVSLSIKAEAAGWVGIKGSWSQSPQAGAYIGVFVPVRKGETFNIYYGGFRELLHFHFNFAQGERETLI